MWLVLIATYVTLVRVAWACRSHLREYLELVTHVRVSWTCHTCECHELTTLVRVSWTCHPCVGVLHLWHLHVRACCTCQICMYGRSALVTLACTGVLLSHAAPLLRGRRPYSQAALSWAYSIIAVLIMLLDPSVLKWNISLHLLWCYRLCVAIGWCVT